MRRCRRSPRSPGPGRAPDGERLLEVKDLTTHFFTDDGVVERSDGVSFHVDKGETLGVVGESGCGKSVTALSIMRLIPQPPGRSSAAGSTTTDATCSSSPRRDAEDPGKEISMIFQEPMTSLNPSSRWASRSPRRCACTRA